MAGRARPASAPPPIPRTGPGRTGRAGRTPPSRPSGSATTCASSGTCWTHEYGYDGRPVRPLRPGLRAHPHPLRPAHRRRASRTTARSSSEAADLVVSLRRIAVRRARRRPVAGRTARQACSATELVEAFGEFKRSSTRTTDEPRQGRRPVPARREPAAGQRLPTRGSRRPTSPSPRTTAGSPTRPLAASASASAAGHESGVDVPELPGRPARRSTPPAAGPGCCSRC